METELSTIMEEFGHLLIDVFRDKLGFEYTFVIVAILILLLLIKPLHKKIIGPISWFLLIGSAIIFFFKIKRSDEEIKSYSKIYQLAPFKYDSTLSDSQNGSNLKRLLLTLDDEWPFYRYLTNNGLDTVLKQDEKAFFEIEVNKLEDSLVHIYRSNNILKNRTFYDESILRIFLFATYERLAEEYRFYGDKLRDKTNLYDARHILIQRMALKYSQISLFHRAVVIQNYDKDKV